MNQIKMKKRRGSTGKQAGVETAKAMRQPQALALRKAGLGFEAIGQRLEVSTATAYRDIQDALAELGKLRTDLAEDTRALELERLDRATFCAMTAIEKGDYLAIGPLCNAMKRRAALLGLDAPVKTESVNTFAAWVLAHSE